MLPLQFSPPGASEHVYTKHILIRATFMCKNTQKQKLLVKSVFDMQITGGVFFTLNVFREVWSETGNVLYTRL